MKIIANKEQALNLLKKSATGTVMRSFSLELRDDEEVVWQGIESHGYALKYASERLSNDPEIVTRAVEKNVLSFKYAGSQLKKDSKFILETLKAHEYGSHRHTAEWFRFCAPELQSDRNFSIDFLKINSFAMKYLEPQFKAEKEIALIGLSQNEYCFQYIKKELRDTQEITQIALHNPHNFTFISKKYKNDEKMCLLAVKHVSDSQEFNEFSSLGEILKNNKEFFKKVISSHPILFKHASDELKKDCELLRLVLEKMDNTISYEYTNNKELLSPFIKKNAFFIIFASEDILNDRHIILDLLKQNPRNLAYAGDEIKNLLLKTGPSQFVSTLQKIISMENLEEILVEPNKAIKAVKL